MTNINQSKLKKATKVFNEVFNKYDFMNDIMSLGTHRLWKKRMIEWMNPKKDDYLVDIASGTGDVAKAFLNLKSKEQFTKMRFILSQKFINVNFVRNHLFHQQVNF